jgi:hypothetical protein
MAPVCSWHIALVPVVALNLGACATTPQAEAPHASAIADRWPTWAGGEPQDVPARTAPPPNPSVYANSAPRNEQLLTGDQQAGAAADLDRLRNRVSDQVKAAKAFDDDNTAAALSDVTRGELAADHEPELGPN